MYRLVRDVSGGNMKKTMKQVAACILALCLTLVSAVPVLAANENASAQTADKTVPTAETVKAEALATANYVLAQTDFSDLSDTSKMYNCSTTLILAIRAGADCTDAISAYLNSAKKIVNADGTLNVSVAAYGYPNDTFSSYAYLLMVLALTDNDATNFEGANIVLAFNNILKNAKAEDFNNGYDMTSYASTGINPYHIGYINSAVEAYSSLMPDYSTISATLKAGLVLVTTDNKGINYGGSFSADNNGTVYPHFAKAYADDANMRQLIDKVIAYTETTYFDNTNGTTHSIYNDYFTGALIDEPNPDSTALALALYSQFDKADLAAASYNALVKNYKSATTAGAYTYGGADSMYSSKDALTSLVTYSYKLQEKGYPFDVSDALNADNTPDETKPDNGAADNNTTDENKPDKDIVNTGDASNALPYAAVTLIAFSVIMLTAAGRTNRNKTYHI